MHWKSTFVQHDLKAIVGLVVLTSAATLGSLIGTAAEVVGAAAEATAAAGGPDQILGLYLWYKADALAGLKDGDVVTRWNDSGSRKIHLDKHQGGPVFAGQAINQLPAVRFQEGQADGLQTSAVEKSFTAFKFPEGSFPRQWAKPVQAEAFMTMDWGYTTLSPLASVDWQNRSMVLANEVRDFTRRAPWDFGWPPRRSISSFPSFSTSRTSWRN